jgi:cytidine deaminase
LLYEFGGDDLLLDTPEGIWPMSRVLPQAFGADDLSHVTGLTTQPRIQPPA